MLVQNGIVTARIKTGCRWRGRLEIQTAVGKPTTSAMSMVAAASRIDDHITSR